MDCALLKNYLFPSLASINASVLQVRLRQCVIYYSN